MPPKMASASVQGPNIARDQEGGEEDVNKNGGSGQIYSDQIPPVGHPKCQPFLISALGICRKICPDVVFLKLREFCAESESGGDIRDIKVQFAWCFWKKETYWTILNP